MPRELVYLAHPVGGDVDGNVKRALAWLAWLRRGEPGRAIVAPWIAGILAGENDDDPEQRERGLLDCETTCERVDGIVLVGGRISSGMQREIERVKLRRWRGVRPQPGWISDLTSLGATAPGTWAHSLGILAWGRREWSRRVALARETSP